MMNESSVLRVLATVCQEVPRSRWESHFVLASCHHTGPQSGHAGCLMRRAVSIPPMSSTASTGFAVLCAPFRKALAAGGLLAGPSPGWVLAGRASRRQAGSELPPSLPPLVGGGSGFQPREGGVLCGDAVVGDNPRTA